MSINFGHTVSGRKDQISHISDTAIWIARYRQKETRKKNPVFTDPLASILLDALGEKGKLENLPGAHQQPWPILARTIVIDELINHLVEQGVKQWVNLASGLDTRPYRLPLDEEVDWWDVDFSNLIAFKEETLKPYQAHCRIHYFGCDLRLDPTLSKLKQQLKPGVPTAVLTEGLLLYLEAQTVKDLGVAIASLNASHWICDFVASKALGTLRKKWNSQLGPAPMEFAPSGPDWFCKVGWNPQSFFPHLLSADHYGFRKSSATRVTKSRADYLKGGVAHLVKATKAP